MNMLAEVYLGKASMSYQTTQAVIPKLLSHTVNHVLGLSWRALHFPSLRGRLIRATKSPAYHSNSLFSHHMLALSYTENTKSRVSKNFHSSLFMDLHLRHIEDSSYKSLYVIRRS